MPATRPGPSPAWTTPSGWRHETPPSPGAQARSRRHGHGAEPATPGPPEHPVTATSPYAARRWRPPPFITNPWLRWFVILGGLTYLTLALSTLNVNWARVQQGWARAQTLFSGFLTPDFTSRGTAIMNGMLESLTMTVIATVLGVLISIPFAFGAARNIAPLPIYLISRAVIVVSRSFQEIVIAIFFVVMIGFGPLAGTLTLAFATIGFLGKLLAEAIEDIDPQQLEAIRATGANWFQLMGYGVVPQVGARFVGLSLYRFDINFRESSVLGLVGAGGIGATLNTSIGRYEYSTTAAIILLIVVLVLLLEYISGIVRKRLQ